MNATTHPGIRALIGFCAFAWFSALGGCATAPTETPVVEEIEKPSFSASQTDIVTAVVAAIDYETRQVTLIDDMGDELTFTAGDNVRNLQQVSVGDTLVAEHIETVSIQVLPGDGLGPEADEVVAAARAEEGDMPGAMIVDSVVIVAVVKAINLENNTFILEFPDGELQEYEAMNPDNLTRADVGDLVEITVTESLAIAVEKTE